MSAAPQIRTALMENLKDLHLPAMRECFEQAAGRMAAMVRQAGSRGRLRSRGLHTDLPAALSRGRKTGQGIGRNLGGAHHHPGTLQRTRNEHKISAYPF